MGHYGCGGVAESMRNLEQPIFPKDVPVQSWIHPIREIYQTSTRFVNFFLRLASNINLNAAMTRPEIVAHRDRHKSEPLKSLPGLHDRTSSHYFRIYIPSHYPLYIAAFRALVEENVKSNVQKIANSVVIKGVRTLDSSALSGADLFYFFQHYENVVSTNGSAPASTASSDESSPLFPPVIAKGTTGMPITEVFIHGWVYDVENGKVSDLGVSVGPPGRVVPTSPFPLLRT